MKLTKVYSTNKLLNSKTNEYETAFVVAEMSSDGYCDRTTVQFADGGAFPQIANDIRFLDKTTEELKALGFEEVK